METLSLSVRSVYDLLDRIKEELHRSQSASQPKVIEADLVRIKSYQVQLKEMIDAYYALPVPDFPKSTPLVYKLKDLPEYAAVENASVNDLIAVYQKFAIELVEGQSSRLAMSFNEHDYKRYMSYIAAIDQMLTAYIEPFTPVDFPETSFRHPSQPNFKGVGPGAIAGQ